MGIDLEASNLIGKTVKTSGEGEIGVIVSFIMDPSGQVTEVLIERGRGVLEKYPMAMLQIEGDEVFLSSTIEQRIKVLSEKLPTTRKKRQVLEQLAKDKIIPQAILEGLVKKFDKALKEMKDEAKSLMEAIEKEARIEEDRVKTLQIARAFLEIEHAIGNVSEETYKHSIVSLLKGMKTAQERRLELLRTRERIEALLEEEPEATTVERKKTEAPEAEEKGREGREEKEEAKAIPVRITQE